MNCRDTTNTSSETPRARKVEEDTGDNNLEEEAEVITHIKDLGQDHHLKEKTVTIRGRLDLMNNTNLVRNIADGEQHQPGGERQAEGESDKQWDQQDGEV